jgi:outer membrane protein assembly factor BamB
VRFEVSIDSTAGGVEIDDARLDPGSVSFTARVQDGLSGVARAACNGRPAVVEGQAVRCTVPARDGLNDLIVSIKDFAGNSASAGKRLFRHATTADLELVPETAVLNVGDRLTPQVLDTAGAPVVGASLTASDPFVVSLNESSGQITAVAPGRTTIVATYAGQVARLAIDVVPAGSVTEGTALRTVPPLRGATEGQIARTAPFDGAVAVSVERDAAAQQVIARGLSSNWQSLWKELAAVAPSEKVQSWMGDAQGGVLVWVEAVGSTTSAIVRIGRNGTLWRHECDTAVIGNWAMGWDGTLYVQERPAHGFPHVTGIDSLTGAIKFRVVVPPHVDSGGTSEPAIVGPLTVPDGVEAAMTFIDAGNPVPGLGYESRVAMLRISGSGDSRIVPLTTFSARDASALPDIRPEMVVPDNKQALLALLALNPDREGSGGRVIRLEADLKDEYDLPAAGEYVHGPALAFTTDGRLLVAFDAETGQVAWTRRPDASAVKLVAAMSDGGVMVRLDDAVHHFDADGHARKTPFRGDQAPLGR